MFEYLLRVWFLFCGVEMALCGVDFMVFMIVQMPSTKEVGALCRVGSKAGRVESHRNTCEQAWGQEK